MSPGRPSAEASLAPSQAASHLSGRGIHCLTLSGFVNVYFVEHAAGWALIDSGSAGHAAAIEKEAERLFGDAKPTGIFLTHGHADHAGSARALAERWGVPIYASEAELPFLTGRCDYPRGDPHVGGPLGLVARFIPTRSLDLGKYATPLFPEEEPGEMPGWKAVALPGHTPGQVGFWRESDRTLLCGDALTTRELNSWSHLPRGEGRIGMPPAPFTLDWFAVRKSVQRIGELAPAYLGAGHGRPLSGDELGRKLETFLEYATIARKGRYVARPVRQRADGTLDIPVVPPDPAQSAAGLLVGAALLGAGWWLWKQARG
jgi:glyoxylase-like metal-dependent hydrolase (beta-lactamase superfamily II)